MKNKLQKNFSVFIFRLLLSTLYSLFSTAVGEAGIFVISSSSRTFRSTDGTSWTEMTSLPAPGGATYQDICRDALGHLYVLRSDGYVYRSINGGRSWTPQSTGPVVATNYDSILADTGTAGIIYVMRITGEVYRSINAGVSWSGPPPTGVLKSDIFVGIGIGRDTAGEPVIPRLFMIDDDGDTYYTNLSLSDPWSQPPQKDVSKATDYTDLHGGKEGYLYVIDDDAPVTKSETGATSPWVDLTNSPPGVTNLYARIEQDKDILDSYPRNLYALRTDGRGAKSLDGGSSAWTSWTITGAPANTLGLTSCDLSLPTVINNVPEVVKSSWHKTDPGAIYDVDFQDINFGTVFTASYTINSLPLRMGTTLQPWTTIATNINTSLYSANWGINFLACLEATTNFVSVKVLDNGGNETTVNDVFYVLKDTTSPTAVTLEVPSPGTTVTYQNIFFNWTDASDTRSGVENYLLQISTDSNFSIINYSSSPVISQATITITVDNLYYWRVRAKDRAGNYSATWSTRSFTVNAFPPSLPQNFTATAGGELVDLSWNANPEGDMWRYEIQRSTYSSTLGWSLLTYILHPGTTHQDKGLVSDNTYYYKIQAVDTANNPSGFTSPVSAIPYDTISPLAVTNLTASPGTNEGEIKLSWSMPGDDGMNGTIINGQIKIQTSTVAGVVWSTANAQITISTSAVSPGTTVGYTIKGLEPSATYYFRLWTADEKFNWSGISNGATSWAQDLVPSVPTNFQATAGGELINLSWSSNTETDMWKYEIYYSSYSPGADVFLSSVTHPTTWYQHTSLIGDNTYYYKIRAVDRALKFSAFTSTVSAIPYDTIPPAVVTDLLASPGTNEGEIKLSWSMPGDDGMYGTIINGQIKIQTSTVAGVVWSTANAQITISTSGVTPGIAVSHTIGGLVEGATYYFRLWTADEKSNWSGISSGATTWAQRQAPENVTAFSPLPLAEGNKINLSWSTTTITASDFQGVRICASTITYPLNYIVDFVTDVVKPTTYYLHTNLNDNVTYYYTAFAYDNALTPNYASGVSTSTYPRDILPPANVSNFIALGGDNKVTLSWINVFDDQKGTRICSTTTPELLVSPTDYFLIDISTPGNTYVHTGLDNDVTYYYKVFAYDEVPNFASGTTAYALPTAVADTLYVSSFAPAGIDVLQGSTTNLAYVLIFTVNANTVTITGITVRENGTSEDSDVSKVSLIDDLDLDSSVNSGDILLSTANFTNGIATFTLDYSVTTTTRQILIAFDVSTVAVHGKTIQTRLANQGDITVQPPDIIAIFSDYKSNTFTIIDVSPPSNVTNFTCVALSSGNQIDLSWQNPPDIDYQAVVIRYRNDTYPTNVNDGLYVATVTTPNTSYSHTGLTDGTTYYYTAFARDAVPNYASGVSTSTYPRDTLAPANVTLSSVSIADNQITLNWTNPLTTDTSGVLILRSTAPIIDAPINGVTYTVGTTIGVSSVVYNSNSDPNQSLSWTDTGLINNATYYYKLFARDEVPNYASGVSTSTYPRDTIAPNPVNNLTAQPGSAEKTILLSWNYTGDNADTGNFTTGYYRVQLATYSAYPWDRITAVEYSTANVLSGASGCHIVTGTAGGLPLLEGGTYYFRLWLADEARNWSGISNSTFSWAQREAPMPISTFTAVANPVGNRIDLSWVASTSTDYTGTRICASTVSFATITDYTVGIVTTTLKPTTYYFHTGLTDNVTYYYKAFSYDNAITPNYSIGITTSTYPRDKIPPAGVTNLLVELTYGTSVQLRWTAPGDNGVTGDIVNGSYWIKYSSSVSPIDETNWDGILTEIQWATNTAPGNVERRAVTGLQSDTTYYFALKTRDEVPGQWSYVSNCATGTTRDITPPAKVNNLLAESGLSAGSVRLTWTAPGDDGESGTATIYWIKYSQTLPFDWDTATTWKDSRLVSGPSGTPEEEIVDGLSPGTTYYFYLKTADEILNWSDLSNGATGYATPVVAKLILYKTTTYTDAPFTADNSCQLSLTSGVLSNIDTFAETGRGIGYMQFHPLVTNRSFEIESLPDAITQYGWLYQAEQEFKTLFPGKWSMKIGWQSTSAEGRGYLWYRISKVSATVSGTIVRRETLLPWRVSSILGGNDVLNHTTLDTPTVSSTTFTKGEFLFIEFFIQQSVAQKKPTDGWHFQVNTASNYVITPDIRDITPPATIGEVPVGPLYAVASTTKGMVDLSWPAVGNNGLLGQATYYDIRYVTDPNFDWTANWELAKIWKKYRYSTLAPGATEYETVTGLTPGVTYYFRLRAYDDATPANWSLSNLAVAWVYVATHTVNVYNTAPTHRRMNNGKKDDLLKITISNANAAVTGRTIYLSTVTLRFTRDGSTALTTAEAQNLFQNIYLYADDQQDGFYHYSQDITTVAWVTNANISLTDGNQKITTLTVGARRLNPQEIKNYFLVVELQSNASSQTPSTFTATISGLTSIIVIDENSQTEDTTLGTNTVFPLVSYSVAAIEPATKRPGTNWPYNIGAKVQSVPLLYWDRVYIGADDGRFYCLDSSGTNQLWSEPFSTDGNSSIRTAPFPDWKFYNPDTDLGPHYLYFSDVAGNIYKIEDQGTTFSQIWKRTGVKASTGSWLGYDLDVDNLYFGSTDAKVYKINYSGGDAGVFPVSVGGTAFNSTPVVDTRPEPGINSLWIGNEGGELYRIGTDDDGTVKQSISPGGAINASPNLVAGYSVDVGGTGNNLYFASTNGILYCRTASNLTSIPSGWSDFNANSPIYSNPYFTPYENGQYIYFGADNGKLYKLNAATGAKIWEYQTDDKIRSTPMSDGTYVYFTSDDGYIYCLTTGGDLRNKWPVQTGAPIRSSPMIDLETKTLTVGSDDGNVYQIYIGE